METSERRRGGRIFCSMMARVRRRSWRRPFGCSLLSLSKSLSSSKSESESDGGWVEALIIREVFVEGGGVKDAMILVWVGFVLIGDEL